MRDIVIPGRSAVGEIRVFWNEQNTISISQTDPDGGEDQIVVLDESRVTSLIKALRACVADAPSEK